MNIDITSYTPMIYSFANKCYNKIKGFSSYTKDDLVQEGIMIFYKSIPNFDESRASFSTFLSVILRNHYAKLVIKEYKNKFVCVTDIVSKYDENNFLVQENGDFKERTFSKELSPLASDVADVIGNSPKMGKSKREEVIKDRLGLSQKDVNKAMRELKHKL